jgi:hypothetical protein
MSLICDQDDYQRPTKGKEDWMAFGFDDAPSGKGLLHSPEMFEPWIIERCRKMKNGD